MQENKGSFQYQQDYYDTRLIQGENPYGVGAMQNELQVIRKKLVKIYTSADCVFVDIGAGLGESSIVAKENGANVISIDVSTEALHRIREIDPSLCTIEADGMNVPLATSVADCVSLWEILEHTDDPKRLLSEAHRILKVDGVLLLSTPNENCLNRKIKKNLLGLVGRMPRDSDMTARNDHFKEYPYYETLEMLKSAGFSIESWQGYGLAFPPAWKLQKLSFLSPIIKLHVYSGQLAPSLAQETYIVARCVK